MHADCPLEKKNAITLEKEVAVKANVNNCNICFLLSQYCGTMVIMWPIVCPYVESFDCLSANSLELFEAVPKAT